MDIKRNMLYKILVMVVILLFIGVAVQPSIAVNPISSDNKEDCDICPKVSKSQIVVLKSLINRVETIDNKLSIMSKFNPEVAEKNQEISDRIKTLAEMNNEIKQDTQRENFPIICIILFTVFAFYLALFIIIAEIMNFIISLPFQIFSMILQKIKVIYGYISLLIAYLIFNLLIKFGCIEFE